MLTPYFWGWVVLAVVLGLAEMVTGGFFMLPFAVGAAMGAIVAATGTALLWQLICFAAVTGASFILARLYIAGHNAAPVSPLAGNRLIGQQGIVVEAIDPVAGTGLVRVKRERWRAESSSPQAIPEGARVRVASIEGVHLIVDLDSDEAPESHVGR